MAKRISPPWSLDGQQPMLTYKRIKFTKDQEKPKYELEPYEFKHYLDERLKVLRDDPMFNWILDKNNIPTHTKLDNDLDTVKEACTNIICFKIDHSDKKKFASDQNPEALWLYSQISDDLLKDHKMPIKEATINDLIQRRDSDGKSSKSNSKFTKTTEYEKPPVETTAGKNGMDVEPKLTTYSPMAMKEFYGKPGNVKYSKIAHDYHKYHETLLFSPDYLPDLFQKIRGILSDFPKFEESNIVTGFDETKIFGIKIDFYTSNLIHFCAKLILFKKRLLPDVSQISLIAKILLLCGKIVMGRYIVDCVKSNKISTDSGFKNWESHTNVLIRFAALLTSLVLLIKLCKDVEDGWYELFYDELQREKEKAEEAKLICFILETIS